MRRNRTMKDKRRAPLTRAARAARNSPMSAKRKGPASAKDQAAKTVAKPPVDVQAKDKPRANRAAPLGTAKAAAKLKAKLKRNPKPVAAATLPVKPTVAAKAKPARSPDAAAAPASRPRLRRSSAVTRKARSSSVSEARFAVGDVVRHKFYPFRGVVFDIDPVFANTDDWWLSIPEQMRPKKNQPFYHLLAENAETEYIAYVSEQNLLPDTTGVPVRHPQIPEYFIEEEDGRYRPVFMSMLN
jgi:heat shock protein HspQ